MKLEHVAINVDAPKEMAAWWAEHMGLSVVLDLPDPPMMTFVSDGGGSMVELYNNTNAPIPDYNTIDPFTLHFAFTTEDIAADRDRLIAAGATADGEIAPPSPRGDVLCFVRDPWGVTIQLIQRSQPLE